MDDTSFRPFAKRSLGQNFLQDRNIAARIVGALDLSSEDEVLEIGPGRGALTEHIAAGAPARFMAVEKDTHLARELEERWPGLEVLCADALAFRWEDLQGGWKIVGNLPYNIASPLIWEMVSRCRGYSRAVVMVQYEVALRLRAAPGGREYGALSAWVQSFSEPRLLFKVSPNAFKPRPKVDSGVVRLTPLKVKDEGFHPGALAATLKFCFSQRRKQLGKILRPYYSDELEMWFKNEGLEARQRPEEVAPGAWQSLSKLLKSRIIT